MQWVLLAVIAVALIFMSSRYPKVAFSLLALLIGGTGILLFNTTDSSLLSRQKIPNEKILIENAVMVPAYADSYRLSARVVNTDETTTLRDFVLSITMLDCADSSEASCQVIGQTEERINIKIPAKQARDIQRTVSFHAASPEAVVRWKHKITQTRS